ncbi:MAG: hemerythrin domain-containing protein [Chloroflexi bacterium]|jgi:hemerythrin-like domain-containing protein|nr:hemerythrin domain-containing protein [Chloroflexota bacterium]
MDVFEIIHNDHEAVQKILTDLEETTSRAHQKRKEGLAKFTQEIEPHMLAEEEVFYPQIQDAGKDETEVRQHVIEGYDEHRLAKMVLSELQQMDTQDEAWAPKLKVLKDLIEHHIEEEESEIFEGAREVLNQNQIDQVTKQFQQAKDQQMQKGATA